MKKRIILTSAAAIMLLFTAGADAYKFDFTTVSDIVKKVKNRFGEVNTYQADFQIVIERLGKKTVQSGIVKYKSADKLLVEFYAPAGQRIIANGKMMWIYIPGMNVVAEQDLHSDSGLFSAGTKSGLNRLFSKYHYRFASKEQPEKQPDGTKQYTMFLKQKESRSGFRTIKLWITEDYFISRAQGETSTGKKLDINFSNIKSNIDISNGVFKFEVPARARIIKNPMISEE